MFKKEPDKFDYESINNCKVCDNAFKGRFCNVCGEKIIEPGERSIIHFFSGLLNAFTFLDSKFFRSVKLLLFQPGQLSRNIADGKRVLYMNMLSLFFVANFFYFLFPLFDSYNSSLYTQMNLLGSHSVRAKEIVRTKIENDAISIEDFQKEYSSQSTNLSKLLIILLVFAFTACVLILNYSKNNLFFDHLLFSLEFYSFQLLLNSVLLANFFKVLIDLGSVWNLDWRILLSDKFFTILTVSTMSYFLIRGQLTFYRQKWYWVIPKTIVLIFMLQGTVILYRMLLFYVTIWML
jgi:hypothetical protein